MSDYIIRNHHKNSKIYFEPYFLRVLINKMEIYADYIITSGEYFKWNRILDMPQSIMSRVVFNTLLNTNDCGFDQKLERLLHKA